MKKILKVFLLISFGVTVGFILGEILLRVYNPLPTRVLGSEIRLFSNYEREVSVSMEIEQVDYDKTIRYSTNTIGFRGENLPTTSKDYIKIFTVGGSTTECSLLDDTKTWSYLLQNNLRRCSRRIWLNNAGIDGCSTWGHLILLEDHLLQHDPDIVVFLVGINDLYQALFPSQDEFLKTGREHKLRKWAGESELFSFILSLSRSFRVKEMNIGHGHVNKKEKLTDGDLNQRIDLFRADQAEYRLRLERLITRCQINGIQPVLITQPLYNTEKDHISEGLKLYNETTSKVALENKVVLIDLAKELAPRRSYYYDNVHYTNKGAEKVAEIIYNKAKMFLQCD